jgi:hypothetical protein
LFTGLLLISCIESDSEDEDEDDLIVAKNAFQHHKDMTSFRFSEEGFRHPMFPFVEKRATYDDYGESITAADFMFAEVIAPAESKVEEVQHHNIEANFFRKSKKMLKWMYQRKKFQQSA